MNTPNPSEREKYLRNQPRRVPLGYESYAGDKQFATTLARGLELLRCFNANDTELSNAELASLTSLPKATISRLTYTLVTLGYLRLNPKTARYQLGGALLSASYPLLATLDIRLFARSLMQELADDTGAQVAMAMRDRIHVVLIEVSRPRRQIRGEGAVADVGLTFPIAGSAVGRAWYASCKPSVREALANEIRIKAPDDWARYEQALQSALEEHRQWGLCTAYGDLVAEVVAVGCAAPVLPGGDWASFNCAFLKDELHASQDRVWLRKDIGARLKTMVGRIQDRVRFGIPI